MQAITIMIRRFLLSLTALACLAAPAVAITVEPCDWRASLEGIPAPWEEHTRTFANGDVRITVTDMIEPAAGAYHLVIISPPYDELGAKQCQVVSLDGSLGFARMIPASAQSSYDPATGLTLILPSGTYNHDTGGVNECDLSVTINQATGQITANWADESGMGGK
ncbi:MAG: hypothetical protein AB8B88_03195 [Devosiaceae bacterium]